MGNWPFTDGGRAAVGQARRDSATPALGICADYPPPLLSVFPDLREIEIGATTIVMRFEAQGQTLIIDSVAFAPHPVGVMFGVPSGPDKHLRERLTLTEDRRAKYCSD